MNPQMQNYQRYAQAQAQRAPPSGRRPGECDSSTSIPSTQGPDGNPAGRTESAIPGPSLPQSLVTTMPNVPHPPPYSSPHRPPAVSSFSTPHTSGRTRNNDTPISSDNNSQLSRYKNVLPALPPARPFRHSYSPSLFLSPESSPEKDLDFPESPTLLRKRAMESNNSGRFPASRFPQGPPQFQPGLRAPGLDTNNLGRMPAPTLQQGHFSSAMDIDSQGRTTPSGSNQVAFGPGMAFNNQTRLPAVNYQQGWLGSGPNFNNQGRMPASTFQQIPQTGMVDSSIQFSQAPTAATGYQQPRIPGTNLNNFYQAGFPMPQGPPSPRTRRALQVRAEMAQIRKHDYLGLPYTSENASLPFMDTVPNQHANIAAQQHQQQLYQQQMAQRNAALEHQLAQRRAKKPTDLNMPEGLEDIVIGDGVQQYKALREAEKRLDYTMMRKRLDIQDTLNRNVRRQKTMRIWINNTCANQPWQRPPMDAETFDFNTGEDSTFELEIRGKIIDPDSDSDDDSDLDEDEKAERAKRPKPTPKKFLHYFKGISVDYEIHQQNPNMPIDPATKMDWKKTPQKDVSDCDSLFFKRPGDENQNITINLIRDEPVERYRLSNALANTLDLEEADRAEVVMGIWEYVKAMGLQEDDERRHVRCDERLKSIFNTDAFLFPQVAERIMPHLHPLPPIKLAYTLRLDEAFQSTVTPEDPRFTVYDVKITVEDPLRAKILAITQSSKSMQNIRHINDLNDQLAVIIQAIHHHKARYDFFKAFSRDPVGFLKKWKTSQQRDLSIILGEMDRGDVEGLEFAKGGADGVWGSEVVQEAVRYKLAKGDAMR